MGRDRFLTGYSDLSLRALEPLGRIPSGVVHPVMVAHFTLNNDVSSLFPYINALVEDAIFYEKPVYIKFLFQGFLCGLHPCEGSSGLFENYTQACDFLNRLIAFLNETHARRETIRPNPQKHLHVPILDIFKLLPKTNCGQCGYPSCMAFAAALSMRETDPVQCRGLGHPIRQNAVYPVYDAGGNLARTVEIDIDTGKIGRMLKEKQERIVELEQELARLAWLNKSNVDQANGSLPAALTDREVQVLRLIARGAANTEISHLLQISHHTVKSHVIHIFNKLGVDDRTQAAVWAAHHDLA